MQPGSLPTVPQLFEAAAAEFVERIAVRDHSGAYTYGELLELTNSVTGLIRRAVGTEGKRIAVLADQSVWSIAAMLAVFRAGKIWIPLEPRFPESRLRELISDSRPTCLICTTSDALLARRLHRRVLQTGAGRVAPEAAQWNYPDPESPSYVLYTSGTTGKPKGVVQSHRNLAHHIVTYVGSIGLSSCDRIAQLTSLAVDAALMDVLGALCSGACLELLDVRGGGMDIAEWIADAGITVYHSTPTLFRFAFRGDPGGATLSALRCVVLGGEEATSDDFELFRRNVTCGAVLVNGLGPTESTLALQGFFPADTEVARGTLSVGKAVAHTRAYLLDARGEPTEDDEGELGISSAYVALGYLNDSRLTERKFASDSRAPDCRLYRTGDVLRRLPGGDFVFARRMDRQVKIFGHRVEPSEVEARLRAVPGVRDAAVVVRRENPHSPSLVGFAVLDPWVEPAHVRARLRQAVPEHLVPAHVEPVSSLPLTPGGKVDRVRLAELPLGNSRATLASADAGVSEDEIDHWLRSEWTGLLGVPDADADDNFLLLGGHSLVAARLVSRIARRFGVELSVAAVLRHPTLGEFAAEVRRRLRGGSAPPVTPSPLPPSGECRLSFAQERLWFLQQWTAPHPVYHVPVVNHLTGGLDLHALGCALGELAARHESLRTVFPVRSGKPVQRILPTVAAALETRTLDTVPGQGRWEAALRDATTFATAPFDLETGPLFRVALLALGADEHLLVFVAHHLIADGWTVHQLMEEWSALYTAARRGEPPSLPGALQYRHYSEWQRQVLTEERARALEAWWAWRLGEVVPIRLGNPAHARESDGFLGESLPLVIDADLGRRIREAGAVLGVTPYVLLLAAWTLLLSRYTGEARVVVGTASAGRHHPGTERIAGTFVNTLALAIEVPSEATVCTFVQRTGEVVLASLEHEDLPFERLVAAVAPDRDPLRQPLFETMLLWHGHGEPSFRAEGVHTRVVELDLGTAVCDISISLRETERGFGGHLQFSSARFDRAWAERLGRHLLVLLDAMARDPDGKVGRLELLDSDERRELLVGRNRTGRAFDLETPIHVRFARWVDAAPDRVAVACGARELTYAQLDGYAGRLARELRAAGVREGSFVPILSHGGVHLVAALLGVLRTGGAFVPCSFSWPAPRVSEALRVVGSPVVVADSPEPPGCARRLVVQAWPAGPVDDGSDDDLPCIRPDAESPVYGIFTSGSTGSPKLAVVPHRGLNNRFRWMDEVFGTEPPVTLQTTTHTFDSSVWQLLWPLTRGGRVVIPPGAPFLSLEDVAALVEMHGVTLLDFVPSVLEAWLPSVERNPALSRKLATVRHLILGGEAPGVGLVQRAHVLFSGTALVNLYGPTEATIGCIAHWISPGEDTIPIGSPIANVSAFILDTHGRLVPAGCVGELYLGGACLGLGYLGDDSATRAAFVANPFAAETGCPVLYRTGDLARYREDGRLEFLGRRDEQVKVRGIRVEPAEVEAVLRRCPGVREAVVVSRADVSGSATLAAWIAPRVDLATVRAFLREHLPSYLVPSRIGTCNALPRRPGGKLDRRSLGLPPTPGPPPVDGRSLPAGGLEGRVAEIWRGVLGHNRFDLDTHFFDAGGSSLHASVVCHRLRSEHGLPLALVDLFHHPTVRTLAAHLSGAGGPGAGAKNPVPRQRSRLALQRGLRAGARDLS